MRTVALLGSTGSVGTQAVDVVLRNPDRFRVVALAAGGGNPELLARQAEQLGAEVVGIAAGDLRLPGRTVLTGPDAAVEVARTDCDVVLNGMTGSVGLAPTLAALEAGRTLALANKESLIVGGPLVQRYADRIVPVDSEHSALAQCLRGGRRDEVRRLVLTASGGPFKDRDDLDAVTVDDALAHPTWRMGPVITVNSATLVNKGLEVIEAHLLFGVPYDAIDVVVHPQSLVHSMVEFTDGSTLAQVSPPDMRLPIALALGWPDRIPDAQPPVDWTVPRELTFEPLDEERFPAVALAREAGEAGGTAPAVLNAANEEAVAAFLAGRLRFPQIVRTVATVVHEHLRGVTLGKDVTLADVLTSEAWARDRAREVTGAATVGQVHG